MRLKLTPNMNRRFITILIFSLFFSSCQKQATEEKTSDIKDSTKEISGIYISQDEGGKKLLIDGEPFEIKGITFGYNEDVANYDKYFKDLQFFNLNHIFGDSRGILDSRILTNGEEGFFQIKLADLCSGHGIYEVREPNTPWPPYLL